MMKYEKPFIEIDWSEDEVDTIITESIGGNDDGEDLEDEDW